MVSWQDYLKDIYFSPKHRASFGGSEKLYRAVQEEGRFDLSRGQIQKWLHKQEPYSLQKPLRYTFQRTPIVVAGIDDQWSADLMDMKKFSKDNNGYSYVLVVVDTFSKYMWVRPLKDKQGSSVSKAFEDIFKSNRKPNRIRTDKGQEFRAKSVTSLMQSLGIRQMFAQNEKKAAVSERAIKTIKSRIYRYLTYKNSFKYIDNLQDFVDSYNKIVHRTIGMAPNQVNKDNEEDVRLSTYLGQTYTYKAKPFKYKTGDRVRITYLRNSFSREYDQRWSGEVFTVSHRFRRGGVPIYKVKDYDGDDITGSFYQQELQKVDLDENNMFKIETVLKTRGKGQNKQYFVKWLHWPKKFNSWIKASDIDRI